MNLIVHIFDVIKCEKYIIKNIKIRRAAKETLKTSRLTEWC